MNTIPKIIHQIWIGPKPEPTIWTDTFRIDYLSAHPEYEYRLWNDEQVQIILCKYPTIRILYDLEETWNGKSDILRYVILHEHGGIYIDADSVWVNRRSFDILLDDCQCGLFAAREPGINHITGGIIGASVGHPIFMKLIHHLETYLVVDGEISKKRYTRMRIKKGASKLLGPTLFNQYAQHETIKLFPSHYFYPITWHGIKTIDAHKHMDLPADSFMFQYGYSTNDLSKQII